MEMEKLYRVINTETKVVYGIFDLKWLAKYYAHELEVDSLIVEEFKIPVFMINALFD